MPATLPKLEKVRAGFYRVGALSIQKGERWCVYHDLNALPLASRKTLYAAVAWAQSNQPKESA